MREERLSLLTRGTTGDGGTYVLYWMSASPRTQDNMSLAFAQKEANRRSLPLWVVFVLDRSYPGANRRHFTFLMDGLREVASELLDRGVAFRVVEGDPPERIAAFSADAAVVVADRSYGRIADAWRDRLARTSRCPTWVVEDNVTVPVAAAYPKAAVGARVLRGPLGRAREAFLNDDLPVEEPRQPLFDPQIDGIDLGSPFPGNIKTTEKDVPPVPGRRGGMQAADTALAAFLDGPIERYAVEKNDPTSGAVSGLSPYLHFGQLSVRETARRVLTRGGEGADAFLEELIVRRELAVNFVHYVENYDGPGALPNWAAQTLGEHAADPRPALYDFAALENGETHDEYWNACQNEMVHTGVMHGYMRMYWGKKVIEWSPDTATAWRSLITLNDRYELDGRDPNGYAGIAWCFGLHDRPWPERPVFGKVRYMNDKGLRRKFDTRAYIRDVESRIEEIRHGS